MFLFFKLSEIRSDFFREGKECTTESFFTLGARANPGLIR